MKNLLIKIIIIFIFGSVPLIFSHAALSIPGDIFYVQVDVANLRQGDSLNDTVILWLKKGHRVMEIQRKGEWVEVVADWTEGQAGWIHSSIIGKKFIGGEDEAKHSKRFDEFKNAFDKLNRFTELESGIKPFLELKDLGEGTVQIIASDFWLNNQTNINKLYSLLSEMGESKFPIAIHIIDQDGNRHLSMIR